MRAILDCPKNQTYNKEASHRIRSGANAKCNKNRMSSYEMKIAQTLAEVQKCYKKLSSLTLEQKPKSAFFVARALLHASLFK